MNLPRWARALLYPVSLLYGCIVRRRANWYDSGKLRQKRLKAAVISVGNVTVGGTGKTPMVLWLAEKFLTEGKRVGILSRGYRGAHGTSDEIELFKARLGERVAFGVGADRYAKGREIEERMPVDIFLLDDGFQHRQLARDLDILMLDGSRKLRDEWLLPAGALREPISACKRADVIVVSRKFERPNIEAVDSHRHAIFYSQTRLLGFRLYGRGGELAYVSELGAGPFFAFCGIGNPDGFFGDLRRWHVPMARTLSYRDHHKYSDADLKKLVAVAKKAGATALVTTEKDLHNLPAGWRAEVPLWTAVIDLTFTAESELVALIERKLRGRRDAIAGAPG